MISRAAFEGLRLRQFIIPQEIENLENWQYLGLVWVGEKCFTFTDCLQLRADPLRTRCIDLDLRSLPSNIAAEILTFIGLPLYSGMAKQDVDEVLGRPFDESQFVADRNNYNYRVLASDSYEVEATIHENIGLFGITVISDPDDIRAKSEQRRRLFDEKVKKLRSEQ